MKTESPDLYPHFRQSGRSGFTNWLKDQALAESVTSIWFIEPDTYRYRIGYLFKWSSHSQMTQGLISTDIDFYEGVMAIVDD